MTESNETGKNTKIALVTAGANGIGLAISKRFLQEGLKVHICDVDAAAIAVFLTDHPNATASLADVSDPAQVATIFDDLKRLYGRLDIVVNNAGISGPTAVVEEVSIEQWQQTVNVDLNGQFYVTRLAVPMLKAQRSGSIINIASSAALFGFPLRSPYTACKWAMIGLTKTWAMELGGYGIRVNAICPGSVNGPRIEGVMRKDAANRGKSLDEIRDLWTSQTSLRTFVDGADIAAAAWFLASDQGRYVSGQSLAVDGHTESLSSPL